MKISLLFIRYGDLLKQNQYLCDLHVKLRAESNGYLTEMSIIKYKLHIVETLMTSFAVNFIFMTFFFVLCSII